MSMGVTSSASIANYGMHRVPVLSYYGARAMDRYCTPRLDKLRSREGEDAWIWVAIFRTDQLRCGCSSCTLGGTVSLSQAVEDASQDIVGSIRGLHLHRGGSPGLRAAAQRHACAVHLGRGGECGRVSKSQITHARAHSTTSCTRVTFVLILWGAPFHFSSWTATPKVTHCACVAWAMHAMHFFGNEQTALAWHEPMLSQKPRVWPLPRQDEQPGWQEAQHWSIRCMPSNAGRPVSSPTSEVEHEPFTWPWTQT